MSEIEEHYSFDSWNTMNAIFSNNLVENVRSIEELLDVRIVARECTVKIYAASNDDAQRILKFFGHLEKRFKASSNAILEQPLFDQTLRAFRDQTEHDLQRLFSESIKLGSKKRDLVPRNLAQLNYIQAMRKHDVVFGIGAAGTGKTYLAMAMAISSLLQGDCMRIILTRPALEAGENLGFLPGNLEEKIMPYLRPLYDALYDMLDFDEVERLIHKNIIEIAPLAFMRGRTLNNAFVILDEAQNTTTEQMLMFLTRLGFNSSCVITGDPSQTDLPDSSRSGLAHAAEILKDIRGISVAKFSVKDVVRHSLVEKIIKAYEKEKEKGKDV